MAYILKENLALRQWSDQRRIIVRGEYNKSTRIDKRLFDELSTLDGSGSYTPDNILSYVSMGWAEECEDGKKQLTPWQLSRTYDTPYTPMLKIAITEKCNFNCLHCFNAADNNPISIEMPTEKIMDLLDQARDCGVEGISLTGGEPMLHKDFLKILDGIYDRGMYLYEICTNGSFITQTILDHLKEKDARPEFKISFDGIGFHEWMRNVKGCEKRTLEKIKLCVDNGFAIGVHFNVNRKNTGCVTQTLEMLDEMGVNFCKLLPTTPAPRWEQNAKGTTFDAEDYINFVINTAREYISKDHNMNLHFWQLFTVNMKNKTYCFHKAKDPEKFDDSKLNCELANSSLSFASSGKALPCMQHLGFFEYKNIRCDNIYETSLHDMLLSGCRLDFINSYTAKKRAEVNGQCLSCEHYNRCGGGNHCVAQAYSGDFNLPDPFQCMIFKGGYENKIKELFASQKESWKNTSADAAKC